MPPLLPPGLDPLLRAADAFMRAILVLFIYGLAVILARGLLGL